MNEKPREPDAEADALATLVRSAGPRAMPDASKMTHARESIHAEWRASVALRRRQSWQWLSLAALVVLAAGFALYLVPNRDAEEPVGVASRVSGAVEVVRTRSTPGERGLLSAAAPVHAGDEVDTRNGGRLLLLWRSGATVRIDRDSRLELESRSALRLLRGTVYIDTDSSAVHSTVRLVVLTPAGEVSHVGTRFEVSVGEDHTRVRVRDGTALFTSAGISPVRIASGQQLSVSGGRATLEAGPRPADAAWEWTHSISPAYTIEGRSLYEALEWLGHELGLEIEYATAEGRTRARAVILHGSIDRLPLRDALTAVLTGSGFDFDLGADSVQIRAAGSD